MSTKTVAFVFLIGFASCNKMSKAPVPATQGMEATCPQAVGRVANEFAASLGLQNGQCVGSHNEPISEECCTRPWQKTLSTDECSNPPLGWTAKGDFCYDGTRGEAYPITGPCCDRFKAQMHKATTGKEIQQ